MVFSATVRDPDGIRRTVSREAESRDAFVARLRAERFLVLSVDEVTILAGAAVEANFAAGTRVINNGGALTPIARTRRDKVTLWTDATDASTFTYAKDDGQVYNPDGVTLGDPLISEWRDCRADHQVAGALRFRLTAFDPAPAPFLTVEIAVFRFSRRSDAMLVDVFLDLPDQLP